MSKYQSLTPEQLAQIDAPIKCAKPSTAGRPAPTLSLPEGGHSHAERAYPTAAKGNSEETLTLLGSHMAGILLKANGGVPQPVVEGPYTLIAEFARQPGRSLFGPDVLPAKAFKQYLNRLAKSALRASDSSPFPAEACSPRAIALILGGMSLYEVEVACEAALEALEFEDQEVNPTLSEAMALVGYNPKLPHLHHDGFVDTTLHMRPGEGADEYQARMTRLRKPYPYVQKQYSARRQWLAASTQGPFVEYLQHNTGFYADLHPRLRNLKVGVMLDAWAALRPDSELIQPKSQERIREFLAVGSWTEQVVPKNEHFAAAVRMVYEGDWDDIRLTGDPTRDVEPVMARLIIAHLCKKGSLRGRAPVQINARCLIGMSLLTGIPTGKFVQFALADQKRRGETFMSQDTVQQVIDLVDTSGVYHLAQEAWMEEMADLAKDLHHEQDGIKALKAQKLRAMKYPLFSAECFYNVHSISAEGTERETWKCIPRRDLRLSNIVNEAKSERD